MKGLLFLFLFLFATVTIAQVIPLSKEEIKYLSEFEDGLIDFRYEEELQSYVYVNQEISQQSFLPSEPSINVIGYIRLLQKGQDFCFGDATLKFTLNRRGTPTPYNRVKVFVGYPTEISNGDAPTYEFDIKTDGKGHGAIAGEDVLTFISKARELNKPLVFNFFEGKVAVGKMTLSANKAKQKLGGLVATYKNLGEKFVTCSAFE